MSPLTMNRYELLLLPLLAAAGLPAQDKIADTLKLADGSAVRSVEITQAGTLKITYKKAGKEESVDTDKVKEITWSDAPEAWTQARGAEDRGELQKAAELYMEAAKAAQRPILQADARFLAGRALLAASGGDAAKAAAAGATLKTYLDENPDGWRVPEARLLLARSLARQGKLDEAHAAAKEVESTAMTQAWAQIWQARARVEQAEIELAQGKTAAARSTFQGASGIVDAILQRGPDDEASRLKMRTLVGQGEAFIADNKLDDALRFYRGLAGSAPRGKPDETLAVALAGEGQTLYLKGSAGKDLQTLRQAQAKLAEASLMDVSNGSAAAKALFYSGLTLLALGPDKEKDAKTRAHAYFTLVAQNYTDTPWAARARAEMEKR